MYINNLRELLRPCHDSLERHLQIDKYLASKALYTELLSRFYGVVLPLEEAICSHDWPSLGFDMARRRKAGWLRQDLCHLGLTRVQIDGIPLCPSSLEGGSYAEALGAAYVLEGSTLGGVIISRQLNATGITPDTGGRYFHSYGENVGRNWSEFRRFLEDQADILDAGLIAEGARSTFAAFERGLCVREAQGCGLD